MDTKDLLLILVDETRRLTQNLALLESGKQELNAKANSLVQEHLALVESLFVKLNVIPSGADLVRYLEEHKPADLLGSLAEAKMLKEQDTVEVETDTVEVEEVTVDKISLANHKHHHEVVIEDPLSESIIPSGQFNKPVVENKELKKPVIEEHVVDIELTDEYSNEEVNRLVNETKVSYLVEQITLADVLAKTEALPKLVGTSTDYWLSKNGVSISREHDYYQVAKGGKVLRVDLAKPDLVANRSSYQNTKLESLDKVGLLEVSDLLQETVDLFSK